MNRHSYLAPLAGLPVAALVAWRLGGGVGAGALLGAFAGTALSVGGLCWIGWASRARPKHVQLAFVATFLVKLAVLTGGALLLRFVEVAAQRFEWSAYLLGFAAAVLLAMALSASAELLAARHHKEPRTS